MGKKAAATGDDPFRVLPDDLLDHILSFLPGDDALQTCVLDTRWRDLWRGKTSLCFILDEWSSFSREHFYQLVKLIIQLRGYYSPLTDCQIICCVDEDEDYGDFTEAKPLIDYVLKCRVEKLSVCASNILVYPLIVHDSPLISRHLRTIEFGYLCLLTDSSADFSGCPLLEELTIERCDIDASKILCSKSLKHLRFSGNDNIFPQDIHMDIDAPGLISFELGDFEGPTPSLEEMPLLEKASILLGSACWGICSSWCDACSKRKCWLLSGLSNAVDLKLIADSEVLIFQRDLKWCPEFVRLKTLTLGEWFTPIDLFCILKHSPILKKLILQLGNTEKFVAAKGSKQSFACASILAVNIECGKVDEGVRKLLEVLSTCGILREQISLKCRDRA